MLDKFIFENHLGQRFDGLANGVYLNYSDLRDYSWSYDIINNRISRFYRSVTSRKLPLSFVGKTDEEAIAVKNRLLELAEADIVAMRPGKIYVGEYYTSGYITASAKSDYLISKRYTKNNLTFTSEESSWFRDRTYVFSLKDAGNTAGGSGRDYPYDYAYDYSVHANNRQIVCDTIGSNRFKIRIYGETTNPAIRIGGHIYSVTGMIRAGETLLIDSVTKTITLTNAAGEKINWFDKRNRKNYIFEPIPSGVVDIVCDGTFGFDLTIVEERSEPKWT